MNIMISISANLSKAMVKERLSRHDFRKRHQSSTVPPVFDRASVLVPIFKRGLDWHVLLTVRAKHLRSQAGNVAFPGGKQDPDDIDEITTALREAEEEVGLEPDKVDVISMLPMAFVRPNIIVSVIIGIIPGDFKPTRNKNEVEKVFSLPLRRFLQNDYSTHHFSMFGTVVNTYHFHDIIDGELINTWGFTGMNCLFVAVIVYEDHNKQIYLYPDIYINLESLCELGGSYTEHMMLAYKYSKL